VIVLKLVGGAAVGGAVAVAVAAGYDGGDC
jgi:hypothetical protein